MLVGTWRWIVEPTSRWVGYWAIAGTAEAVPRAAATESTNFVFVDIVVASLDLVNSFSRVDRSMQFLIPELAPPEPCWSINIFCEQIDGDDKRWPAQKLRRRGRRSTVRIARE